MELNSEYIQLFVAYLQNEVGKDEELNIDLIMLSKVRFLPSDAPFCCGVPGAVSCDNIPF